MRFLKNENLNRALLIVIVITLVISPVILFFEENKTPDINTVKNIHDLARYLTDSSTIANIQDSFWWTVVTLTTVGYGDFYPKTIPGRIISLIVMFIGIGVVSIINSSVAQFFVEKRLREEFGMGTDTYKLKNHIILCEWNPRSKQIVQELRKHDKTKQKPIVLIADIERKPLPDENLFFIKGQVNDETLNKAKLEDAKTVIILGDDKLDYTSRDAKVILSTLTVESINKKAYTIVEIFNESYIATCKRACADEIILSSNLNCNLIVSAAINHGISEVVSDILNYSQGSQLYKIPVPKDEINRPFIDVFIRMKQNEQSIVIAIQQHNERKVISNPPADYKLRFNDHLIIIADHNQSFSCEVKV